MKKTKYVLLFLCLSAIAIAQKAKKWDVNNPPGKFKEIEFSTTEGTWINLDVSPDGQTIVFDMMGDIYIMPISGGKATALRSGVAYEVQPRFSPDGKKIAFTSDAGGGDNIWTMNTDGSDAKQITKESFRLLNNPVWMPDGEYIVARKHFSSTRSLGAGEMWMYHITGGSGIQITKRKNDQQDVNEPSMSKDGRYLYYSEDVYPGGYFQYNKDPNKQIFAIKRYDRNTGKTIGITGGPGGACRPQISNDGKTLAFVRRVRTKSVLFLHDLESGEETPLYEGLGKDQQEAWTIFGIYPGFAWTPNDKHLVMWGKDGKIWKVDATTGSATEIPFSVDAKLKIYDAVRFKQEVAPDEFTAKVIRQAETAPNGKYMIFNAVGYLWKKELPNGTPKRFIDGTDFQFEPSFSKDGKWLTYVTWSDSEKGKIWKLDLTAKKAKPIQVSTAKGIYRTPRFSPDGKQIVYRKEGGNSHQGYTYTKETGIYTIAANGGTPTLVTPQGEQPRFSPDGKSVYFQTGGYLFGGLSKGYKKIDLEDKKVQTIFNTKYTNQFVPSPDGKWIAFTELFKVYIAPFPKTGKAIGLSANTKAVPVAQVGRDAGINLHWSSDSKALHWTLGEEYFTAPIRERFLFVENAVDSIPPMDTVGLKIGLTLKSDKPEGITAFTNARIITVNKDNEVIENGTLLVKDNKIIAVGKTGDIDIPKKAKIIDAAGKTIMPGIVDVHAHVGNFRYGLSPQQQWSYFANLAYGVTTVHDPSSNSEMIFSQSEMVKTGNMIGPRIYSTGVILYGAEGDFKAKINSLEDARSALRRTKAFGAFSVKSYNQPRREQRQQVIQAARELEMNVVPEGGSFFYHNMSMIIDGHSGVEHNIPVVPLYKDVREVWRNSETGYTPTLIVNYGSVNGEFYWYQHTNVYEKERLLTFTPRAVVDGRSRHRMMIPEEEYENGHILTSKSCKALSDAGVKVNLGAHGQLQGLGAHWELWMLGQGGMTPLEAIRSATMNGAWYIGMDEEIGSLETGKLADLIVLDKNPLENIQNTEFVKYTMLNGRLYDAATMNEIGHYSKERQKFWWEFEGFNNNFEFHQSTMNFLQSGCSCRH